MDRALRRSMLKALAKPGSQLEIAYRLDPSDWGQGLATEGPRSSRLPFDDPQLARVISLIGMRPKPPPPAFGVAQGRGYITGDGWWRRMNSAARAR